MRPQAHSLSIARPVVAPWWCSQRGELRSAAVVGQTSAFPPVAPSMKRCAADSFREQGRRVLSMQGLVTVIDDTGSQALLQEARAVGAATLVSTPKSALGWTCRMLASESSLLDVSPRSVARRGAPHPPRAASTPAWPLSARGGCLGLRQSPRLTVVCQRQESNDGCQVWNGAAVNESVSCVSAICDSSAAETQSRRESALHHLCASDVPPNLSRGGCNRFVGTLSLVKGTAHVGTSD
jgi:hypothetical protein